MNTFFEYIIPMAAGCTLCCLELTRDNTYKVHCCGGMFHFSCILNWVLVADNFNCPNCSIPLVVNSKECKNSYMLYMTTYGYDPYGFTKVQLCNMKNHKPVDILDHYGCECNSWKSQYCKSTLLILLTRLRSEEPESE